MERHGEIHPTLISTAASHAVFGCKIPVASEAHAMEDTAINYTLREPIGVVGCISPWNFPLYLFTQ